MDDILVRDLEKAVGEDKQQVKSIISQASPDKVPKAIAHLRQVKTLYSAVLSGFSQDTRNTSDQIRYLEAYETACATFRAASLQLRQDMDVLTLEQRLEAQIQARQDMEKLHSAGPTAAESRDNDPFELRKQITDAVFFSNRYALFFAGQVGLALLNEEKTDIKSLYSFGAKYDASKDRDELTAQLALTAMSDIERVVEPMKATSPSDINDDVLKRTMQDIFTSWVNQFSWDTFKEIAQKHSVDRTKLKVGNYSVLAGDFRKQCDIVIVDPKIMKVKREDVIGGDVFCDKLWESIKLLSRYNQQTRENRFGPPFVIFTYGEPGGGKSYASHAVMQSFAELMRKVGKPVWVFPHSVTDYASHYQNKTAVELNALAGRINEFPGAVLMYVADADNVLHSRKEDNLTIEQRQTQDVYMKMFDGTLIPKNGKVMILMDANYIDKIDDATKSRVFDEIIELKRFDKPEYFAALTRKTLTNGTSSIALPDEDWNEIGDYLLKSPLSNREISHVIGKLRRVNLPDSLLYSPDDEVLAYRNQQLKEVTKDAIIGKFQSYIDTRLEIERASYESKKKKDYERWLEYLATPAFDTRS